jgi:hypothetical protein
MGKSTALVLQARAHIGNSLTAPCPRKRRMTDLHFKNDRGQADRCAAAARVMLRVPVRATADSAGRNKLGDRGPKI